jgi:DnaJ-class molecular chaperone
VTQTKKAKYDQWSSSFDGSGGFGGGGGHAGMNMDDIFSQFVIFSAVPLVVVADLRRRRRSTQNQKQPTNQSKIDARRSLC